MSASRERKKRAELAAQGISPKQMKAAEEKKKQKRNRITAIVIVALILAIGIGCLYGLVIRPATQPRKTVALRTGDHELSATEFGYYYYDAVNDFYQNYGSYISYLMEDATKPLDEQVYNEETGETWADYFVNGAADAAKYDYCVYDAAKADGYTISADGQKSIDESIDALEDSVKENGFKSLKAYLTNVYGKGADIKSYRAYKILHQTAAEYAQKIDGERTYSAEQIQAKDDENPALYNSVTYRSYYLSSSNFMGETVNTEEATEEEIEAAKTEALAAAGEAAEKMAADAKGNEDKYIELTVEYASESSKETYENPDATLQSGVPYEKVSANMQEWLFDSARKEGDTGVISDGGTGYYVLYFLSIDDNNYNMVDVRQILFQPAADEDTDDDGTPDTISDQAKADAKAQAEELLAKWQAGDATEESFAALSDEKTGGTDGGLCADIYHNQMVEAFDAWCFDESRKPGDVEIVETNYGFHVIYFVGECDNYRESQILQDLKEADYDAWIEELSTGYDATVEDAGKEFLRTDLVLGSTESAA